MELIEHKTKSGYKPRNTTGRGYFKPGHTLSVGNRGPSRPDLCTQALISQLNEIDKTTKSRKIHMLASRLIMLAMGYKYSRVDYLADGTEKVRTIDVQPDIIAIREIYDRVEGKARQSVDITAQIEVEDVTAARAKLDKIIELKRNETIDTVQE